MSLNKIVLQGRIGSETELKTTPNGKSVLTVQLAVDRDHKNENGERDTDWFSVIFWGAKAEFVTKYFKKGDQMVISGRLQSRSYTDKDGNKRKSVEIIADDVYFCGMGRKEDATEKDSGDEFMTMDDEEVPFN